MTVNRANEARGFWKRKIKSVLRNIIQNKIKKEKGN